MKLIPYEELPQVFRDVAERLERQVVDSRCYGYSAGMYQAAEIVEAKSPEQAASELDVCGKASALGDDPFIIGYRRAVRSARALVEIAASLENHETISL